MNIEQSEHKMRTIEARIKEEQELRLTAFYADKVKRAQAKLWSKHELHARKAGVSTPCTAHHVNYGGGCLNCGYQPK